MVAERIIAAVLGIVLGVALSVILRYLGDVPGHEALAAGMVVTMLVAVLWSPE